MSDLYKYRIYCETESTYAYIWAETEPTVCPNNNTHTIDSGSITIIEQQLDDELRMSDGRSIVSANSRPVGYYTMFTMAGDTASGIGDGQKIVWDFSNDDDLMASGVAPEGYKGKCIRIDFLDPVYVKEGCLYFHNADQRSYIDFDIVCPDGQYYLDRNGAPVQANGDVTVVRYVNKHHFSGDCPMGDELNTESANESAIPSNYEIHVRIYVPENDNDSYGYGELELYRARTILLPGESP